MLVELRIGVIFWKWQQIFIKKYLGLALGFSTIYLLMKVSDILVFKYIEQGMTKRSQWLRDVWQKKSKRETRWDSSLNGVVSASIRFYW